MLAKNQLHFLSPLLLFLMLLASANLISQVSVTMTINGKVMTEKSEPLPGVHILNDKRKQVTVSNVNGMFSMDVQLNDTLRFSFMGYEDEVFVVKNTIPILITLKSASYELEQYDVVTLRSWAQFKKDFMNTDVPDLYKDVQGLPKNKGSQIPIPLRSNLFVDKPTVLAQVMSPFSTLAYYTSKTEKSKRKVLRTMNIDRKETFYRDFMTHDRIREIFPLQDSVVIDEFIKYCNSQFVPENFTTEYYLTETLKDSFPKFLIEYEGR